MKEYVHYSADEVFSIKNYGSYFPAVVKEPSRYIVAQPELREILVTLRSKGKQVFLATNSHVEYTELIMTATLGSDWRDFFDLCL
jgi:FMN phosphatase YigB (HAD superfamily)